jgi:hypothetical protein
LPGITRSLSAQPVKTVKTSVMGTINMLGLASVSTDPSGIDQRYMAIR